MNPKDILIKFWGHTSFRLKQEQIINEVIEKRDTLALLPTSGGKSICYQISALMQDGICLVISPLIALMNNQVRFLSSKGIKSVAITSSMHYNDIDTALTNCIYGGIKFLYLSPERLQNQLVKEKLNKMNINLIAVDEAHCISEWGHNFRPSYRQIADIRSICKDATILALTATATNNVAKDIQRNLEFKKDNIIRSSFLRENLSYVVNNTNNKEERLLKLVEKIKSPIIVYANSRKSTQEITDLLISKNYSANYYHGGLSSNTRKKTQEDWENNQTRIMVATNAFGMGINKEDVKLVIHMDLPSTIETYFQEAGRAGRNGKQAYSFLLFNQSDLQKKKKILKLKYPDIHEIKECYQNLANFLQISENTLPNETLAFDITVFSKRYKMSVLKTYNTIKYLEKEEHLRLYESLESPSKLMITVSNRELYKFQISNKYYDHFIKLLLRSYTNLFNELIVINEHKIAKELKISHDEVYSLLERLRKLEIIKYQPKNNKPQILFLKQRIDSDNLHINKEKWNERKQYNEIKLDNMINFAMSQDKCRSIMLLDYFGENNTQNCNKCDYCIRQKKNLENKFNDISKSLQHILTGNELSLKEIHDLLPEIEQEKITNVLESLFSNDKVVKFGNKYKWRRH